MSDFIYFQGTFPSIPTILLAEVAPKEQFVMVETISVLKRIFGDPANYRTNFTLAKKFWVHALGVTLKIFVEKIIREFCAKCVIAAKMEKSYKKASELAVSPVPLPGQSCL